MRRYLVYLVIVTILLTLAGFLVMWGAPEHFLIAMPILAMYFGIVTGIQHYVVVKSLYKSPRTFVKVFLGMTVGVLFIHLAVLVLYLLHNTANAKTFTLAFCIGYVAFLVFETIALVRTINAEKKKRLNP